jgi:glycosyltransferase involved in cell wall biosynthesis
MFNESEVVEQTLTAAVGSLESNFSDFEIIVADDASTDTSASQVKRWAQQDPRIILVRLERNQRFGGALRRGLEAATKEWIFYTDFDLPVDLDCFPAILSELEQYDLVTGYSAEEPKNLEWYTKLLSTGYNRMVRTAFGLPLRDINFGFKAMRRAVRDRLRLVSRSPFVDAEMFIQAGRKGFTIREIPVPFLRRQAGVSRIRRLDVIAWTILDMARIWLQAPMTRHPKLPSQLPARAETQARSERAQARQAGRL